CAGPAAVLGSRVEVCISRVSRNFVLPCRIFFLSRFFFSPGLNAFHTYTSDATILWLGSSVLDWAARKVGLASAATSVRRIAFMGLEVGEVNIGNFLLPETRIVRTAVMRGKMVFAAHFCHFAANLLTLHLFLKHSGPLAQTVRAPDS